MLRMRFIKENNLDVIRKKLILIFILNVTDICFTLILLSTGAFSEGNPVMSTIVHNKSLSIMFKIFVPLVLLIYIYLRIKKATDRQLLISNIIINIGIVFYIVVNLSHMFWTGLYVLANN